MSEIQAQPTEPIVFEFQHTDEHGQPIIDPRTGKQAFTNFTGKDWQEIAEKTKDAYLNVRRAYARAQNHKPVPKVEQARPKELSPEEERQAAADLQDPTKARAAVRKLTGADDMEERQKAADEAKFAADAKAAAFQFMSNHMEDYFRCKANSDLISGYINENQLDPRVVENYEVAFNAVYDRLAQRPAPAPPVPPVAPKIEEPPTPPKKEAAGGIQPGSFSGQRPIRRKTNEITRETINEMRRTAEGRAEYKKRMRDPEFVRQVNAAFQT